MNATTTIEFSELINLSQHLATLNLGYLGISVTIVALLGGAFYLFNIKPLKDSMDGQDKSLSEFKKKLDEILSSYKDEQAKNLEAFKDAQFKDISRVVEEKYQTLVAQVESKISSLSQDLTDKLNNSAAEKDNNLKTVILAELSNQTRVLEKNLGEKLSSVTTSVSSLERKIASIKEDITDLQIEYHLNKNQIGAMRKMIDKLDIAIKKGWGVEDALLDIKKYIIDRGMPDFYLTDLLKILELVPKGLSIIKDDVIKLANEKIYKLD